MKRAIFSTLLALITSPLMGFAALTPALAQTESTPPPISDETLACLKAGLGETVYAALKNGEQDLTDSQQDIADGCFEKNQPAGQAPAPADPSTLKFAPATEECLKKTLGDNYKQQMASVTSKEQGKSLRAKTKDCFGSKVTKQNQQGPGANGDGPPGIPDNVRECIIKAVGKAQAEEIFSGDLPDGSVADTIEQAGCFASFGPPPAEKDGKAPQMSQESIDCFKRVTGTTPDKRPALKKTQLEQLNKECFKGGNPGGPNGKGAPALPDNVKACFSASGLDISLLTKGPDFLTEDQKQKVGSCFQKNNFQPNGGPNGPGNPGNPGPGGQPPNMSDEARKCIEGIAGGSLEKQPNLSEEQRRRIGQECFKGQGGPGGPGPGGKMNQAGPGNPGGPGPNLPDDKRLCVESIVGTSQPGVFTEDQKRQVQEKCFGGQGGQPGNPPAGNPGPNNGPNNGPQNPPPNNFVPNNQPQPGPVNEGPKDQPPLNQSTQPVNPPPNTVQPFNSPPPDGTNPPPVQ